MSAHVGVDEIKKAVVDMNAAGVDPGTADRQMASFRQLFIGFCRFSVSLPPTNATPLFCLPPFLSTTVLANTFVEQIRLCLLKIIEKNISFLHYFR